MAWTGRDVALTSKTGNNTVVFVSGGEVGWVDRAFTGLYGLVFGAPFLLGAHLVVLAPLQLAGAVRGLAPP